MAERTSGNRLVPMLFGGTGAVAVVVGGPLAAFSAARPSEFALWASAYLVLVVGVLQVGFGAGLRYLARRPGWFAGVAFALYNLGNLAVVFGTWLKGDFHPAMALVDTGGGLLAVAMLLLLLAVRGAKRSWQLRAYYVIIAVVIISMPIGLVLGSRS